MKRIKLILIILLLALLACSTITGRNESNPNDGANNTALGNDNSGTAEDNSTSSTDAEANNTNEDANEGTEEDSEPEINIGVDSEISTDSSCYNAFYPVNQERVWTYQTSIPGEETHQFTLATTEVTEDSLTSTMTFPEFSSTVRWYCGPDGLFSSEFAQFNFAMMPGFDIDTINYEGITLPKEELWDVGYTWDSSYEINVNMSFEGISLDTVVSVNFTSEIVAIEEVTVPAGTFPMAYRVDMTGNINLDMMGTAIDVPLETSTWYVKDVGMIKSVSSDEFGGSDLELVSIE